MKRTDRKSNCAINHSLELIGDPWSLLIVRDIVYSGKKTYGEFLNSDERIGTSVLASRLASLESNGILIKHSSLQDKRKEEYSLTDKGLDLIPVLVELAEYGAKHDPDTGASREWSRLVRNHRKNVIRAVRAFAAAGRPVFNGDKIAINIKGV